VGDAATYVTKPLPVDDPRQRQPDITKARALLEWEPTTALVDGLRPTIEYFRAALEFDGAGTDRRDR
jgi:UDP-glucuronate decarboxylase